jgi:hydrogenase-4 component F
MELAIILLPLAMGGLALALPSNKLRPLLLPAASLVHAACCFALVARPGLGGRVPWLFLDPVGKIALLSVAALFLLCSFYTVSYLSYRAERSNRFFCACLLAFLGAISLAILSHHLGLTWVAVEAMTLMTAPLIYFNHSPRSIEATWKYLLVGSVGIALALLGTFFMAYSSLQGGMEASMGLDQLIGNAPSLSKPWFRASFILLLVGYGTKMGLAPMHTWKPDAYGEAPGVVGALFSGGVTTGAFLALARAYQIGMAAGEGAFMCRILVAMGLLSMAVAGVFMIGQRDFKRMLAYSSVEHMGILVLGLGIGAPALYGTLLHVIANSMTKGVLFLSAGNIHRAYGAKTTDLVRGALSRVPASAALFLAGFLAITGSPPFGPFISEFSILNAAFSSGQRLPAALFLAFLLLVFIGMGITVLKVTQGSPPRPADTPRDAAPNSYKEGIGTLAPLFAFMAIVLLLGLYIPAPLESLLREAAAYLGAAS